MILQGKLTAQSPLYRGNARKTLFTRDGDGSQRLVSLAGEVAGTAEALMDAFIGTSRNGRNTGLLNQLWLRLYGVPLPERLISRVECHLQEASYPPERFFDLRMGLRLDEDRWAAEANANYKLETLYRHSVFDLALWVDDALLRQGENTARLCLVLEELRAGRFWFGGGKSKGLGRCQLEMDLPFSPPASLPRLNPRANHLTLSLSFDAANPVLVGWNWGKVDPEMPAFAAVEGRLLVEALREIPEPIRRRLEMAMAGPILSPEDCKRKLAQYLPQALGAWLGERFSSEGEIWTLPASAVSRFGKGKYPVPKKAMERIQPLVDRPFPSRQDAEAAFGEALGEEAKKYRRVLEALESAPQQVHRFDAAAWDEVAQALGLAQAWAERLAAQVQDPQARAEILTQACQTVLPRFYQQIEHQLRLLQSDVWIDEEISLREEHLRIKTLLLEGQISEAQWGDPDAAPPGIKNATWREFLEAHQRVQYHHLLHPRNLGKSIANDRNAIAFLRAYRHRTRQELAQPYHIDFRAGGEAGTAVSRQYGKPYDTVFMRMLSWTPSAQGQGRWEVYIPGATLKGAFRKRASQVLKTLGGSTPQTTRLLDRLFGTQGQRGLVFFSDAYLADPRASERSWCSMDGIRMDPRTGQPLEEAKADFLFAYGHQLVFNLRLDLQDLGEQDLEAFSVLLHLLRDFQRGDIALGGEKTCGLGWVEARVGALEWLSTDAGGMSKKLFGGHPLTREGMWQRLRLEGEEAAAALEPLAPLGSASRGEAQALPRAAQGFISHRAFGGYCGTLAIEAQVLTPLSVQESGEPSHQVILEGSAVPGWDFFSMSPPEASQRPRPKVYALPSKSLKGMVRHLYAIASDSRQPSPDLEHLNPADRLFGYVGKGPNQALMGRVSFGFGPFADPQLAWFKVPYPYGAWQYRDGKWQALSGGRTTAWQVDQHWRLFPHAPLAPCAGRADEFRPDTSQASYFRAVLPGAMSRFAVRFWNLEQEELQRLIWCLVLEEGLAHKLGRCRYLGFGSLRLRLLPDSFSIDWGKRYAGGTDWRRPVIAEEWRHPAVIAHAAQLRKILDAHPL